MSQQAKKIPLSLYNSLTDRIETFTPRSRDAVKIFTCGPSIYDRAHIGNYRTFLYEDILHRYLEYLGYRVRRLINFTDVEDKAISRAEEENRPLADITGREADNFYRTAGLLHIRLPDYIPRSSTSVDEAVLLITELLQKGYAYRYQDNVFYDPLKFEGFGKLFGLDMSKWPREKRRYWKDTYSGNRWNYGDFILWHAYSPKRDGRIFWDTSLGRGRPAWNIQDPAMISKHLGLSVDISCGGVDNLYRHHDYTIAVMEAVSGFQFSQFWLHGEHVKLEGRKMSKSTGNIIYPATLTDEGYSGACLRFYLMNTHYRRKMNLTRSSLSESAARCRKLQELAAEMINPLDPAEQPHKGAEEYISRLQTDFVRHMSDDLHAGRACDSVEKNLSKLAHLRGSKSFDLKQWKQIRQHLLDIDSVLRVLFP